MFPDDLKINKQKHSTIINKLYNEMRYWEVVKYLRTALFKTSTIDSYQQVIDEDTNPKIAYMKALTYFTHPNRTIGEFLCHFYEETNGKCPSSNLCEQIQNISCQHIKNIPATNDKIKGAKRPFRFTFSPKGKLKSYSFEQEEYKIKEEVIVLEGLSWQDWNSKETLLKKREVVAKSVNLVKISDMLDDKIGDLHPDLIEFVVPFNLFGVPFDQMLGAGGVAIGSLYRINIVMREHDELLEENQDVSVIKLSAYENFKDEIANAKKIFLLHNLSSIQQLRDIFKYISRKKVSFCVTYREKYQDSGNMDTYFEEIKTEDISESLWYLKDDNYECLDAQNIFIIRQDGTSMPSTPTIPKCIPIQPTNE